ncbi:MAG: ammonium transporter, partial [Oxalobacter sp.]|nr:ammonium transporter [Oxalobacter sp.]
MRRGLTGLIAILGFAISTSAFAEEAAPTLDSGDTAWILTSTLLVLLMTAPGIGLFYGGLVRAKNMLSVLMQTFMAFSLVTILWFLYGYSFAFTGDGPIIGTAEKLFMRGITIDTLSSVLPTVPEYAWAAFQGSFACITATLLIGGFAERIKFGAVMAFIAVWFTLSYVPQAHMVWGGGFLQE